MKNIYFVRHGESEMNVAGLVSGSGFGSIDTQLTPVGIEQAKKAGKKARESGLVFDVILSSPLKRAHLTAKTIAEHIYYPKHKINLHKELQERHFGDMEGKTLQDFDVTPEMFVADPYAIDHVPNIEKIEDLQSRADEFWNHVNSMPDDKILIVGHGAFGRALNRSANKLPITEFGETLENAKIIKLI